MRSMLHQYEARRVQGGCCGRLQGNRHGIITNKIHSLLYHGITALLLPSYRLYTQRPCSPLQGLALYFF